MVSDLTESSEDNVYVATITSVSIKNSGIINKAPKESTLNGKPELTQVTGISESSPILSAAVSDEVNAGKKSENNRNVSIKRSFQDELVNFESTCENGKVNISFVTKGSTEEIVEIEKSYDRSNYTSLASVKLNKKRNGNNHYSHSFDCNDSKEVYFRLKRKGDNGIYEYSNITDANCKPSIETKSKIEVYPVGYGSFKIAINSQIQDRYTVTLIDSEKKEVAHDAFDVVSGANEFVLNSGSIPRGSYSLRVSNGTQVCEKMVFLK